MHWPGLAGGLLAVVELLGLTAHLPAVLVAAVMVATEF
jgi:hypothetical protein